MTLLRKSWSYDRCILCFFFYPVQLQLLRHPFSLDFWLRSPSHSFPFCCTLGNIVDLSRFFSPRFSLTLFAAHIWDSTKVYSCSVPCMCHTLSDLLAMRGNINQRKSRKLKVKMHMHYHARWSNFSFCILIFSIVNVVGTYLCFV